MADEEKIVRRKDLIDILQCWQHGRVDSRGVQDWARARFCELVPNCTELVPVLKVPGLLSEMCPL